MLQRKAQLFYLPPYSPDMGPIERAFLKLEAALQADRPAPSTHSGDGAGSSSIVLLPNDCANFLQEAGYQHSMSKYSRLAIIKSHFDVDAAVAYHVAKPSQGV